MIEDFAMNIVQISIALNSRRKNIIAYEIVHRYDDTIKIQFQRMKSNVQADNWIYPNTSLLCLC